MAVSPKGSPSGPTFWSGSKATQILPQKVARIITYISHQKSIENSLLSSQKTMAEVRPRKLCPNMGIRAIFATIHPYMNTFQDNHDHLMFKLNFEFYSE